MAGADDARPPPHIQIWQVLMTRALVHPHAGHVLMPVVDLVNHASTGEVLCSSGPSPPSAAPDLDTTQTCTPAAPSSATSDLDTAHPCAPAAAAPLVSSALWLACCLMAAHTPLFHAWPYELTGRCSPPPPPLFQIWQVAKMRCTPHAIELVAKYTLDVGDEVTWYAAAATCRLLLSAS
eukprot:5321251-Prymnesium_polylepis.1